MSDELFKEARLFSELSEIEQERLIRCACDVCKAKPPTKYFKCETCTMKMCSHYMSESATKCNVCVWDEKYEETK